MPRARPLTSPTTTTIPPASLFPCHPSSSTWTKLTCADLRSLHQPPAFAGQPWRFHLNHPLKHVAILGLVTGVEFRGREGRVGLVKVDDGSGEGGVECRFEVSRPEGDGDGAGVGAAGGAPPLRPRGGATTTTTTTTLLATSAENVSVRVPPPPGTGARELLVDDVPLELGDALLAKGMPEAWRGEGQLRLLRAKVVRDAVREVAWWEGYAGGVERLLGRGWEWEGEGDGVGRAVEGCRGGVKGGVLAAGEEGGAKGTDGLEAAAAQARREEKRKREAEKRQRRLRRKKRVEKWARAEEARLRGRPLAGL